MPAAPVFDVPLTLGAQLDARASHPEVGERPALRQGDRIWTYRRFRDEAVRTAHFLLQRLGSAGQDHPRHVAVLMENRLELMSLYAGCGYAGLTLFGVNSGLRGETLAGVLNQSGARLLVVDEILLPEVERVRDQLGQIPEENLLVLARGGHGAFAGREINECIAKEVASSSPDAPSVQVTPETNLMVIYTSGTTGLPKGINNNHLKMLMIGAAVSGNLGLGGDDVGYACMPLFHSNAMFLGFQPAFHAGACLSIRERFSASGFVPDVLRYGATYWNYVGEPVHYILGALEKEYGDEERILAQVAGNPANRLRYALGNGASPPDIDRFSRWLGLEDMLELYGSTEAAISTFRKKIDPRGSVGEVTDPNVKILSETGEECPPARISGDGKIQNYEEAVGEICRVAPDTGLFQGYFSNDQANASKYRAGVYHSGDLGHVLVQDGKRYLFFDGRTDDWIRKDGENFSAAQVARLLGEHPDVVLAAAYGVPCAVSDELVMAALKLRPGAVFDPEGLLAYCEQQVSGGAMDRKWIPDFIRLVGDFEFTSTQKILVRNLKKAHYDPSRLPDPRLFWRERGDSAYKPFTAEDYGVVRGRFEAAERLGLLER